LGKGIILGLIVLLVILIVISASQESEAQDLQPPISSDSNKKINVLLEDTDSLDQSTRYSKLSNKASSEGSVRVLVELNLDVYPEGGLASAEKIQNQRDMIRSTQDALTYDMQYHNATQMYSFKFIPYMAMRVDGETLEQLTNSPLVKTIHEDKLYRPLLLESLPIIGANNAFNFGYTGAGQTVAVLDTGVDLTHSMFSGKTTSEACYSTNDFFSGATSVCPNGVVSTTGTGTAAPCLISGCDHGTHVAGIAVGNSPTIKGVAKDADIIAIQVFSKIDGFFGDCGTDQKPCVRTSTSDIIKGLERVFELRNTFNIAAVNLSLGGGGFVAPCDSEPEKAIVDQLRSVGIVTIAASGNDGFVNGMSSPACISTVVSVGATDKSDGMYFFSNTASFLDVLAPGVSITSSVPDNSFASITGTSMASPHVAGAWAILKQYKQTSIDTTLSALKNTGIQILDTGPSFFGLPNILKPRIQVDQALISLDTSPPVVTPPSNVIAEATSASGAVVTYPAASATDDIGVTSGPTCSPASGSTFALDTTVVTCTASDAAGNIGSATFTITVQDTTAPAAPTITSPTSGITTNDNTVTLTGDAESLSTVEIFDGATSLGTTTATSPWTFTTPALSDGIHTFTATATKESNRLVT